MIFSSDIQTFCNTVIKTGWERLGLQNACTGGAGTDLVRICMCVCIYIYVYICMCVYTYIYIRSLRKVPIRS